MPQSNDPKYKARKKVWRQRHVAKRNECRKRNYMKSRPAKRTNKPWGEFEQLMILTTDLTDTYLSHALGRSVQAIQQQRYQLLKKGKTL